MAYDKVVDSSVLNAGLTKIADAIRAKGGTSEKLAFPDGMAKAVTEIQAGGGTLPESYIEETYMTLSGSKYLQAAKMVGGDGSVRQYLFYKQGSLKSVTLPDNIKYISDYAFNGCYRLVLSLPDGVISIGSGACKEVKISKLPKKLQTIRSNAFAYCSSFQDLEIPELVKEIGYDAFNQCENLSTVTFAGTPSSVSATAFENCAKLATINVPWAEGAVKNAPWSAKNATINYNYTGE